MYKSLLLGSIVLLLASCGTGSGNGPQNGQTVEKTYQESLDTASSKIKDTPEFVSCMKPAVDSCIGTVGMQLARGSKSIELCDELPRAEQQEGCRFAIVMSAASEKGDVSLCSSLTGSYQSQCTQSIYKSLAVQAKDVSLCEKIEVSANNTTDRPMMADEATRDRDQCILSVVMSRDDAAAGDCDKITSKSVQNICITSLKNKAARNTARP